MAARSWPSRRNMVFGSLVMAGIILAITFAWPRASRPTLDEWEPAWREAVANVPSLDALPGSQTEELCGRVVAAMRQAEADLVPGPSDDFDSAVLDWVEFTQSVFFECPRRGGDHAGFPAGYEEIHRLSTEVEALITFERSLRDG